MSWYIQNLLRPNRGEHGEPEGTAPPELVNDPDLERTIGQFISEAKARREYLRVQAARVVELTALFCSGEATRRAAESACEALLGALRDMEHVK